MTTAINTVGAANLGRVDQFDWWKSEANLRQNKQAPEPARGGNVPVVTDADKADGWRVNQISYPELVDLLEHTTDADAVILFGGTWCPNTRAVLPFVNKYAQENNVTVYNFDTVLDGGIVGGGTTASSNPLQSRNNSTYQTAANANPSFLFGEAQSRFFNNLVTEYNPASNGVAYFPGGDSTKPALTAKRLQVPYLIGYKGTAGDGPNGGVTRQWIRKTGDTAYREYMSQWYYTNPKPGQLGLTTLPQAAPIWTTINSQLANFSWRTDPATLLPNTATDTDDAQYLVAADTATVTYTPANGSTPASVSVASGGANPIGISPAVLSTALAALGASAPANLAAAQGRADRRRVGGDAGRDADREPAHGRRRVGRRPAAQDVAPERLGQRQLSGQRRRGRGRRARAGHLLRRPAGWRGLDADRDRQPGQAGHRAGDHPGDRQRLRAQAGRQRLAGRAPGRHDGRVGVDRGRQRRGRLHAPGPGRGHVRLHVVVRG